MKNTLAISFCLAISQLAICQNTILWKVTDTITHKTSFVLGTHHQFGNSFVDSIPKIKESLFSAELAVFESIDEVDDTRAMLNSRKASFEVKKHLKKKDFEKLELISNDWEVDLFKLNPLEIRWKLQQQFVEIKCGTVKPTDKFDHFDNYLIHLSKEKGIDIFGLETDSLQLTLIEKEINPTWKSESERISYWVNQLTSENPNLNSCAFTNDYRKFNLDYEFDEVCDDDIINLQRNNDWMLVIPDLMKEKKVFIAVGYYHLTKKCGILEQLKSKGFMVEPVNLN